METPSGSHPAAYLWTDISNYETEKKLSMHIFSIIIGIPLNYSIFSRSYNIAWFETSLALHKHINIKPLLQQDKNQSYKACGVVYTTTLKLIIKMCTFDLLHKIFVQYLLCHATIVSIASIFILVHPLA